jgi:hypothetical protein
VALRLGDPEEVRRDLRHLEPGFLNRQARACRFVGISRALGHCLSLRGPKARGQTAHHGHGRLAPARFARRDYSANTAYAHVRESRRRPEIITSRIAGHQPARDAIQHRPGAGCGSEERRVRGLPAQPSQFADTRKMTASQRLAASWNSTVHPISAISFVHSSACGRRTSAECLLRRFQPSRETKKASAEAILSGKSLIKFGSGTQT